MLAVAAFGCAPSREAEVEPAAEPPAGIHEEEVTYESGGVTFNGFLAYDAGIEGRRPGVLVVHEWWGLNDYARSRARMLAEMGYAALALDMYGDGKTADHPDDAAKFSSEVMASRESAEVRFRAALDLLKAQPQTDPERIAAIGYCFGGSVVLHMARVGEDLDGVVSFHGNLASMHTPEPGSMKAKVLVCHGAADSFIPQEQIDAFKSEMDAAGADYRFVAYEGAKHSFTNKDADSYAERFGLDLAYDENADRESWAAMKAFFDEIFSQS
jgi:dienelactone hydrolase